MKIGIITFHFPYNCGAGLQCYALSKALENMGHEVCVIDYCPKYHKNLYKPMRNPFVAAKRGWKSAGKKANVIKKTVRSVNAFAVAVYSWKNYKGMKKADEIYARFIKNNLKLTSRFKTLYWLKKNPPKCDLYISGSDQLWNQAITGNGFDEAYFLKFGDESIGRITYAVSTRFGKKDDKLEKELKELFVGLDAIAVRESNDLPTIDKVAKELGIPVYQTIDPTLLLDKKEYDKIISNDTLESSQFIFTYSISSNTRLIVDDIIKEIKNKENLKIINAVCYPKMTGKTVDDIVVGPEQFLWYIKNAKLIVTDSFHATVFSILFGKNFITVPRGEADVRVSGLLEKLKISGHVTRQAAGALDCLKDIDYCSAREVLEDIRKSSIEYLNNQIEKVLDRKKQ